MISALWRSLRNGDYPIITLEWRRMKRGSILPRVVVVVVISAVLLSALALLASRTALTGASVFPWLYPILPAFGVLILVKWVLLYLVIPVNTSRSIAQEREARSLQMLAMTPMGSPSIILQKCAITLGLTLAAALVSLPMMIPTFAGMGGVTPVRGMFYIVGADAFAGIAYVLDAALYAAAGLWCSCSCANVRSATTLTYLLVILVLPMLMNAPMLLVMWGLRVPGSLAQLGFSGGGMLLFRLVTTIGLAVLFTWLAIRRLDSLRTSIGGGI